MLTMAEDPENWFYYSPEHVVDYCSFAERFEHFEDGSWLHTQIDEYGNPDPSVILDPHDIWIESAIQGFRRRSNGTRLVRTALEEKPRKHWKSGKAAVAIFYDLTCSGGLAPEIPISAASARLAKDTLFGDLLKIIDNEPDFVEKFNIRKTEEEITCGSGRAFKLTGKGEKLDGLNPSLAVFEEGHSGAESVYRVVSSAFGARPNALKRMITTAGYQPEGPGWELRKEALAILYGGEEAEDYTFFAAIYTLDEEDYLNPETKAIIWERLLDLDDERLLAKANPMYRVSLDPEDMRSDKRSARRRLDTRGELARTRYNIWTGTGKSLVSAETWGACRRKIHPYEFIGRKCWIGVDLAQYNDMCAIVLVFEHGAGIAVFAKFYLPESSETVLDPDMFDQLHAWSEAKEKWLTLTPGVSADHGLIKQEIMDYCEAFDVQMIAVDPYQAHQLQHDLYQEGLPVRTYANSARTMTFPTDNILKMLAEQTLVHDGNPVLQWNAVNVHADRRDNGSIVPRKESKHSKRKVDGFIAMVMANGCRLEPENAKDPSGKEHEPISAYAGKNVIGADPAP